MKWYGIFVKTGEEDYVKNILLNEINNDKIRIVVPKRKLTEKKKGIYYEIIRTVFPSYVFIHCDMNLELNKLLVFTDKVYRVLGDYFNPTPIPEEEMYLIDNIFKNEGLADYSKIYCEGENTIIVEGPLKGYESNIRTIDKRKSRAQVIINLNGEEKKVDLGITFINKNQYLLKQYKCQQLTIY